MKNPKLAEFFTKLTVVSDAKRISKDEFEIFDFTSPVDPCISQSSQAGSVGSVKDLGKGLSTDEGSRTSGSVNGISKGNSREGSKVDWP